MPSPSLSTKRQKRRAAGPSETGDVGDVGGNTVAGALVANADNDDDDDDDENAVLLSRSTELCPPLSATSTADVLNESEELVGVIGVVVPLRM